MRAQTPILALLTCLAAESAGCEGESSGRGDTGEHPSCAEGFIADGDTCVPEACGTGSWGALEVDASTVFVDASAPEEGDGSEGAPLRSIQPALDLAGSRGGGLVAVAAGTYAETLILDTDHAGVQLRGRCHELAILDASVGDTSTPGISIEVNNGEVQVAGMGVLGSAYVGVLVGSGVVRLDHTRVEGSAMFGVAAHRSAMAPTSLELQDCLLHDNSPVGVLVFESGTEVSLVDTVVSGTQLEGSGQDGYGAMVHSAATLTTRGSTFVGNRSGGLVAVNEGTEVSLVDTVIRDGLPQTSGVRGYGVEVMDGASLTTLDCILEGNSELGMSIEGSGTQVVLHSTTIQGTRPSEDGGVGYGAQVGEGAELWAEGCWLLDNSGTGLLVSGTGAEVTLLDSSILDTRPNGLEEGGYGAIAHDGSTLTLEGCTLGSNVKGGLAVLGPDTDARLERTTIRDTLPDAAGDYGIGVLVQQAGRLTAVDCLLDSNAELGLLAFEPGTEVVLLGTTIENTLPDAEKKYGYGGIVQGGASLHAEDCIIDGNTKAGLGAFHFGTEVTLVDSTVRRTLPNFMGEYGIGVAVHDGATLRAIGSVLKENIGTGLMAGDVGTHVLLTDSEISGTVPGWGERGASAPGLAAASGAWVTATGLRLEGNEGPGLYVVESLSRIACTDCELRDNDFAGAVVIQGGALELHASTVSASIEGSDIGGGVGIYAAPHLDAFPPSLLVTDSTISDNPAAGVWLSGSGSYQLIGNTLSDNTGVSHGSGTRCGDGVYAVGVDAWDGSSGLLLQGNTVMGNEGAGLFLDESWAALDGNTWQDNDPDLLVQGEACLEPRRDYAEAPVQEICPEYDHPTCPCMFNLVFGVQVLDPAKLVPPGATILPGRLATSKPHATPHLVPGP